MVNNLESIDSQLEADTIWLAKKLSGVDSENFSRNIKFLPEQHEKNQNKDADSNATEANEIIANVHAAMPEHFQTIKRFRIHLCPLIPISRGPEKGMKGSQYSKRVIRFDELLDI